MLEYWQLLLLILIIACSGFTQNCLGFGYAVVAMSLLPNFMDIRLSNLLVSLSAIAPMFTAAWCYRRQLEWTTLSWSLIGAALFMPVGLLTFAYLPTDLLVRGTGLVILIILFQHFSAKSVSYKLTHQRFSSARAGAISGFLAGAVGIGGPPIVAYAIRQAWHPMRFKAFLLAFLLVESVAKVVGLAVAGWLDRTVIFYSAIAIPFAVVGGRFGHVAAEYLNPERFRRIVVIMLVFASLGMVVRGSRPEAAPPLNPADSMPPQATLHSLSSVAEK